MALKKIENDDRPTGAEWMANTEQALTQAGMNLIRQTEDRATEFSNDQSEGFADAYVDANGTNNSVNTGNTTAIFEVDRYRPITATTGAAEGANLATTSTTTTDFNFDIVMNESAILTTIRAHKSNAVGNDVAVDLSVGGVVIASKQQTLAGIADWSETFAVTDYLFFPKAGDTLNVRVRKVGGSGDSIADVGTNSFDGTLYDIASQTTVGAAAGDEIEITEITSSVSIVEHDLPSGTFGTAINASFATAFVENPGDGTVEYKLTNGSDDSGWLPINVVSEFTAFAAGEPTKVTFRLSPGSDDGFPAIKGGYVAASEEI